MDRGAAPETNEPRLSSNRWQVLGPLGPTHPVRPGSPIEGTLASDGPTTRRSHALQAAAARVAEAQPPPLARAVVDAAQRLAAFRPDAAEHLLSAFETPLSLHPEDVDTLATLVAPLPAALSRALCACLPQVLQTLTIAEVRDLTDALIRLPADVHGGSPWPVVFETAVSLVTDERLHAEARRALLAILLVLVEDEPRVVAGEMCTIIQALATLDRALHCPFTAIARRLARHDATAARAWLREAPGALGAVAAEHRATLLAAARGAAEQHHDAPLALVQSSATILRTAGRAAWQAWLAAGAELEGYAALAHYRRQSRRSVQVLRAAQPTLTLGEVQPLLARYCAALAGQHVEIVSAAGDVAPTLRSAEHPSAAPRVVLPAALAAERAQPAPFLRYKVMATHQVAHLEFGTHRFALNRPARYFATWRPSTSPGGLDAFFAFFPDVHLAALLFVALEDARVDACAKRQYQGLADDYRQVQRGELRTRPAVDASLPRAALLEALIRMSLGGRANRLPAAWAPLLRQLRRVLRVVERPGATVEDAAEGTLRLYPLFAALPAGSRPELSATLLQADELPAELTLHTPGPAVERGDHWYVAQPDYRRHPDPQLEQALAQARAADHGGGVPLTPDELRQLLEQGLRDIDLAEGEEPSDAGLFVTDLLRKPPVRLRVRPAERAAGDRPTAQPRPQRHARAQRFVYDEWDFRAQDYRPAWCQLFERRMEEAGDDFVAAMLRTHPDLAAAIRRQILHLRPHQLAKRRGLPEGEDLDLDAAIERVIALRARRDPTDRVFWQRQRLGRDVAVALLLDMSASTDAEVATAAGRRRIIDLAKESLALLSAALESVGDRYGIYGFSGYGRENVEYYVVKELDERYSAAVGRRIGGIRPLRSTRMGPAIRHTTAKLQRSGAQLRLLLLLSDGYPQDHDYYGLDRLERDYALHDTRMALLEARRRGIVPFCLTVDQAGYDYLRTMCDGLGYEVVRDLAALPERLGTLYARLTR